MARGCGAGCCQQANGAGAASFSAARVYSRHSRCQVRGGTAGEPAATELVPPESDPISLDTELA